MSDGTNTTPSLSTTCGIGGTYSVTVDISALSNTSITATSTIDDGVHSVVTDTDSLTSNITVSRGGGRTYSCRDPEAINHRTYGFSNPELCEYDEVSLDSNPQEPVEPLKSEHLVELPEPEGLLDTPNLESEYPVEPLETKDDVKDPVLEIEESAPQPQRYSSLPALPELLPQTGTPLLERVRVLENSALELDPPSWATPSSREDISFWKDEILPFDQDRDADQYVVIPTL